MNLQKGKNKEMNEETKKEEVKTCSKCGKTYTGYGAISREDNKTEICSECGTKEALEVFTKHLEEKKEA